MITFITLLVLSALFFYIVKRTDSIGLEITSLFIGMSLSICLIFHTVCWLTTSYNFNKLIVERDSFVKSLSESRKNGRDLESAAILKNISEFNQFIASEKYDNKIWFLGQYIDDRIETIESIK